MQNAKSTQNSYTKKTTKKISHTNTQWAEKRITKSLSQKSKLLTCECECNWNSNADQTTCDGI